MDRLDQVVMATAVEHGLSGVVRVDDGDGTHEWAFGHADRRHALPNTPGTRFGIASGAKGFTALTVMALVANGQLALDLPVRSVLGDDLPEIDDRVTIEQLLAHRSGIGDYLDESELTDINDDAMPVPVHELSGTESYIAALQGHPQVSTPGERFAYNNGGYVVLAIVAQRAAGTSFEQLVAELVCRPAGMTETGFLRSDALPSGVAVGYLEPEGLRTNVFHLPLLGSGDGGIFATAADVSRFWAALFEGRIVDRRRVTLMTSPHSDVPDQNARYGLGFWLAGSGPVVSLEGYDAGVSFRSVHDPTRGLTHTVLSNTSSGAWPITRALDVVLGVAG